jgi:hypothetical protein
MSNLSSNLHNSEAQCSLHRRQKQQPTSNTWFLNNLLGDLFSPL